MITKKEFKNKEMIEMKAEFEFHHFMVLEKKWISGFEKGALITKIDLVNKWLSRKVIKQNKLSPPNQAN